MDGDDLLALFCCPMTDGRGGEGGQEGGQGGEWESQVRRFSGPRFSGLGVILHADSPP